MIANNPFSDSSGKAIQQFKAEADGWNICLDSLKRGGVYLRGGTSYDTWVIDLLRLEHNGWLVFIEDNSKE